MSDVENQSDQVEETTQVEESAPAEQPDPIEQLKGEFSRKTANLAKMQEETQAQLSAILEQVQRSMQPKEPSAPKKPVKDLLYDDPEEFARQVREEATREATEVVSKQYQASQAVQNAVASLQQQYPEFAQEGSEASMLAIKKAASLPAKLKGTAEGARLAMLETAQELGLVAMQRRQQPKRQQEEPVVGSRSSTSTSQARKPAGKVDEKTKALAELLGLDFNDPKQVAELEKASTRKNWSRYE